MEEFIGNIAFLAGFFLAILAGAAAPFFGNQGAVITMVLALLGLIVGFLNVGQKERLRFLVVSIALLAMGSQSSPLEKEFNALYNGAGTFISTVITNMVAFVAPAALIVALVEIYSLGRTVEGLPEEITGVMKGGRKRK